MAYIDGFLDHEVDLLIIRYLISDVVDEYLRAQVIFHLLDDDLNVEIAGRGGLDGCLNKLLPRISQSKGASIHQYVYRDAFL